MKKIFLLSFLIGIFTLGSIENANASHFSGSDLTYTCLGGNTYQITFTFYRDCSGANADQSTTVSFNCPSNPALNFNTTLYQIAGTGQEITPGCSAVPTSCAGGNSYGIQEYVFQGTVTLPACSQWTMKTNSCCRNTVSTVTGQGSWTMIAYLNNLDAPCNSSPTFSNKPVAVVCNNQSFCFNHGAVDPDGDSLSYSFYTPFTSYPSTISYIGGYSSSNFLNSSTPITIDPITGDICFTPQQIQSTVTGVKVEEWRTINGTPTLIGTVYRDLQMSVVSCNNYIPTLSGMDTTLSTVYNPNDTTYIIDVCLSPDPISFNIIGHDSDVYNPATTGSPEKFSINWNNGIPGGSFTSFHNGTDSAYANFTWLPTANDVGNIKCFTATIQDEACPYNGFQTFSYCITVHGMMVNIGSDTLLCEGESVNIQAVADTSTVNYIWYVNGTPTGTPQSQDYYLFNSSTYGPGQHSVRIETNDGSTTTQCPGVDELIVDVVYLPKINGTMPDSAFCGSGSVTYDAGQGQQYTWTDIVMNPLGASQTFTATNTGTYIVTVNGGMNTRCYDVDTFEVVSIPEPMLGPDTCIWEDDAPFKLDAGYIYGDLAVKWNDGVTTSERDINTSGKYKATIYHSYISPTVGCSDEVIINVINQDNMILSAKIEAEDDIEMEDFQKGDRDICTHQRLKLKAPIAPSGHTYDYTWTKNGSSASTSPVYIFKELNPGNFTIELEIKNGCKSSIDVKTKSCIIQIPNIITPNDDGINDYFKIILKDSKEPYFLSFPNSTLIVYNRWGTKVFESNNYQNDWNGDGAPDGVYYWTLELQDGQDTQMQGTVTILSKK